MICNEKPVKTALYTAPNSHNHALWYVKLRATRYAYSKLFMNMLTLKKIMLKNYDLIQLMPSFLQFKIGFIHLSQLERILAC